MDIKIDSLIPYDSLKTNIEHVFSIVDKNGKVVLLKDNKPAYIVLKSVSYTHLDVYKRQIYRIVIRLPPVEEETFLIGGVFIFIQIYKQIYR